MAPARLRSGMHSPLHEGVDGADDGFGLLDLGIMSRTSNDHQLCGGERRGERLSVGRLGKPVRLSPEHQRRQIDPMQPALQARIVQVWSPTIVGEHVALAREFLELAGGHRCVARRISLPVREKHRECLDVGHVEEIGEVALFPAGELHAHRRDEDQLAEPRVIAHAHLERNPSAERRADENHVVELELVEEIEIEVGQIVDRSEVSRTRRRTIAWMARRNHTPLLCECVEIRPYLLEILFGMQVEKRRARACDMGLDGEALDIECFHFDRPVQAFLSAPESTVSQGLQREHLRPWPRWPELQPLLLNTMSGNIDDSRDVRRYIGAATLATRKREWTSTGSRRRRAWNSIAPWRARLTGCRSCFFTASAYRGISGTARFPHWPTRAISRSPPTSEA